LRDSDPELLGAEGLGDPGTFPCMS
jgi:hypothetical protein